MYRNKKRFLETVSLFDLYYLIYTFSFLLHAFWIPSDLNSITFLHSNKLNVTHKWISRCVCVL